MERSSRLAEITLVSKYYPVANYSYPRQDGSQNSNPRRTKDRSSLGSEGSTPGLVDDRSDSEGSADDDFHYHAHATQLWDHYWQGTSSDRKRTEPCLPPRKGYPALIPSPQQRRQRMSQRDRSNPPAWPLPNTPTQRATYSAFPKPLVLTAPKLAPASPSWTNSRSRSQPQRPPRPNEELLVPCLPQLSPVTAVFAIPEPPLSAPLTPQRPKSSLGHRPTASLDSKLSRQSMYPSICPTITTTSPTEAQPDLHQMSKKDSVRLARISTKSTPQMAILPPPEPQSIFEEDSDSEAVGKSFFRRHKRSGSDDRRSTKPTEPTSQRRHRRRASSVPPARDSGQEDPGIISQGETVRKRQATDVFGRILGRRSR